MTTHPAARRSPIATTGCRCGTRYLEFYESELSDEQTALTFARLVDPGLSALRCDRTGCRGPGDRNRPLAHARCDLVRRSVLLPRGPLRHARRAGIRRRACAHRDGHGLGARARLREGVLADRRDERDGPSPLRPGRDAHRVRALRDRPGLIAARLDLRDSGVHGWCQVTWLSSARGARTLDPRVSGFETTRGAHVSDGAPATGAPLACGPRGARTHDPRIKSPMLYRLS